MRRKTPNLNRLNVEKPCPSIWHTINTLEYDRRRLLEAAGKPYDKKVGPEGLEPSTNPDASGLL